ncbi:MAG: dTMP kinase [Candidatus Iainarchaeum archaeon]|uniref:Probable thymidylate kinase n=1 Tax=Candidatus Iainarchaeum sp. TaxID=3101447 RepID=A0A7T9DJC1_9ARCH|nr:MAG: dTMP kinase [Candidatus Diapherotrites archaeon]
MVSKGLFIVCEGMEGTGKSTQSIKLAQWLFDYSKSIDSVVLTREYTNSRFAQEIRRRLKEMHNPDENRERLMELYVLDREYHVDNMIVPNLAKNAIVVSDRYKHSTICYQGAQGVATTRLVEENNGFPIPDITIVFNASVDTVMSRLQSRKADEQIFEHREFLEKVKENYARLPQLLPKEKIVFINANQTPEQVHEDVIKAVKPLVDAIIR